MMPPIGVHRDSFSGPERMRRVPGPAGGSHTCGGYGLHTLRMDRNAHRDDETDDGPARCLLAPPGDHARRGLALLGVLAWAFSGGGGKPRDPRRREHARRHSVAARPRPTAAPPAPHRRPGRGCPPARPLPARLPGGTTASRPTPTAPRPPLPRRERPAPAGSRRRQPWSRAVPVPPARWCSACSPAGPATPGAGPEVQRLRGLHRVPHLQLRPRPGQAPVVVMSSGRIIWDSADCARGVVQAGTVKLSRGVPVQEKVSWNRSISLPGCVTLASSRPAGTYQVQARTATVSSPVRRSSSSSGLSRTASRGHAASRSRPRTTERAWRTSSTSCTSIWWGRPGAGRQGRA